MRALLMTIYNRPGYLKEVLESWRYVDQLADWDVIFSIDPSDATETVVRMVKDFASEVETYVDVMVHPTKLGVLHHPWVALDALFSEGYDFVVRTEDDLVVSTDVLRYFAWGDRNYSRDKRVATINAWSKEGGDPAETVAQVTFNSWGWGTWRDRWEEVLSPTWDHDYSTYNERPGFQAGFDWNLDTRIFPQRHLYSVAPRLTRIRNIGEWGVHGKPENLPPAPGFVQKRDPVEFLPATFED